MRFVRADLMTVCLGQAGSAAAILLAAGTPGKRMILPHARVMIHQPAVEPNQGQTSDLERQANEILRMRKVMEQLLIRHTGRTAEQVRKDIDRDTILDAEQAVAFGMVDILTPARKREPLAPAA
jgi:ATP-dependent Clp protease, protease subunit